MVQTKADRQSVSIVLVTTGVYRYLMLADSDAVLQLVQRNPSAIAYLPVTTKLSGIRQLGFLRNGQWQAASAAYGSQ